ncbi:tryptophan 2,3-dioxygenase family protein [Streptomyces qinglanensis]|uniref:Tryptophan 2,3-dioxygenase n=1 Tax=Streptomyces qinglanensis TaxID=943816 RepID=A0A1H9RA16_9ACTN|nr:tryptophan 2,3-dioxygenase family protein [Streptomyces qinglanensis]SER68889.1 tryptophan 2,3-dioxygenase [Streptomyces qinglanensis]
MPCHKNENSSGNAYESYLRIPDLLRLQEPRYAGRQESVRSSELFFIVVHQSAELLLTQLVHDLRTAFREGCRTPSGRPEAEQRLRRCIGLVRLQRSHVEVLEHLPRQHFLTFREELGAASASGSAQFAEVFALLAADGERQKLHRPGIGGGALTSLTAELEEEVRRWQLAHLALVQRMLGDRAGTGGSSGVAWLRSRLLPARRSPAPAGRAGQRTRSA